MTNEEWKDIPGYEGMYQISNMGRVKSFKKNKESILNPPKNKDGYLLVNLYKNSKLKSYRVNRLVGIIFITNPENKPQVNHKNGIKTDNRVENLEWNTGFENMKHAVKTGLMLNQTGETNYNSKLSETDIIYMRYLFSTGKFKKIELSRKFNISKQLAGYILNKKGWDV